MRIAIGEIAHETNSFSVEPTDEAAFRQKVWLTGDEIFPTHYGVRSYIGGMLDEGNEIGGYEFLPTFAAEAEPSGPILAETWTTITQNLLEGLRKVAPFDAICLELHGAGIAENSGDIEGDLLKAVRDEFGYDIPLVATLDLHANMTEKMVEHADLLLGVNFYPHTDRYERGREIIQLLHKMLKGEIKPVMSLKRLPMIIPTTTTIYGPAAVVNEKCWEWEAKENMLDCTFYHGFPYMDSPEIGVSVLAIADGNEDLAKEAAEDVANIIWEMREDFQVSHPTVAEGLKQVWESEEAPIVVNETSDNPGAGGPGDGTHLLSEMLKANVPQTCFAFICDPEVVEAAYQAGEGAEIEVQLGGKKDTLHGNPLHIVAKVLLLTRCDFIATNSMITGRRSDLGRSVRLLVGNVDVIVTEIKQQLFDDEVIKLHGIDMNTYKLIALKSSHHFRAFFQTAAAKIITVDSPGISTFNFSEFNYKSSAKDKYPLNLLSSAVSKS